MKQFLDRLIDDDDLDLVLVNCDSQAAIAYTKDPKYHCKTKHIDIKYKFAKVLVKDKMVNMKYLSMHEMVADPLTKPIPREVFQKHSVLRDCVECDVYFIIFPNIHQIISTNLANESCLNVKCNVHYECLE